MLCKYVLPVGIILAVLSTAILLEPFVILVGLIIINFIKDVKDGIVDWVRQTTRTRGKH